MAGPAERRSHPRMATFHRFGAQHFFDAAQPALLYLVPACIGASLLTAAARGEVQTLLNFSVEKPKDAKED